MSGDDNLAPELQRVLRDWDSEPDDDDLARDDAQIALALAAFDELAPPMDESFDVPTDVSGLGSRRWWPLLVAASLFAGSVVAWRLQIVEQEEREVVADAAPVVLVLRADVGLVVDVVEARPVIVDLSRGRTLGLQGRGRVVVEGVDLPAVSVERGRVRADWQGGAEGKSLEVRGGGRRFTQTVGEAAWRMEDGTLSWTAISATVAAQPVLRRHRPMRPVPPAPSEEGFDTETPIVAIPAEEAAPVVPSGPPPLGLSPRRMADDERLFAQALSASAAGTGDSALLLVTELAAEHPESRWVGPAMIIRADTLRHTDGAEAVRQYKLYLKGYPEGHEVPGLHPGNLRDHALSMLSALGQ